MSVEAVILCDGAGCRERYSGGHGTRRKEIHTMRWELRDLGWWHDRVNAKDYCGGCAPGQKRPARAEP